MSDKRRASPSFWVQVVGIAAGILVARALFALLGIEVPR